MKSELLNHHNEITIENNEIYKTLNDSTLSWQEKYQKIKDIIDEKKSEAISGVDENNNNLLHILIYKIKEIEVFKKQESTDQYLIETRKLIPQNDEEIEAFNKQESTYQYLIGIIELISQNDKEVEVQIEDEQGELIENRDGRELQYSVNYTNNNPIAFAFFLDIYDKNLINILLANGSDINSSIIIESEIDKDGVIKPTKQTSLFSYAIENKQMDLAIFLIRQKNFKITKKDAYNLYINRRSIPDFYKIQPAIYKVMKAALDEARIADNPNLIDLKGDGEIFKLFSYSDLESDFYRINRQKQNNNELSGFIDAIDKFYGKHKENSKKLCELLYPNQNVPSIDSIREIIKKEVWLNYFCDINDDKFTPIHYAVKNRYNEIVQLLIKEGSNIDSIDNKGNTPLCIAMIDNYPDIVEIFIETAIDINEIDKEGKTLLHHAVSKYRPEIVELLIKANANVNIEDKQKHTSLYYSVRESISDIIIVQRLIIAKAIINIQDRLGDTPLHAAARTGRLDVVKELIRNKANINIKNREGKTPLYYAAERFENINQESSYDVVKILIDAGSSINEKDVGGSTPLHYAMKKGDLSIIQLLIVNKADVNIKNMYGKMPLHYALKNKNSDVVKALLRAGAKVEEEYFSLTEDFALKEMLTCYKKMNEQEDDRKAEIKNSRIREEADQAARVEKERVKAEEQKKADTSDVNVNKNKTEQEKLNAAEMRNQEEKVEEQAKAERAAAENLSPRPSAPTNVGGTPVINTTNDASVPRINTAPRTDIRDRGGKTSDKSKQSTTDKACRSTTKALLSSSALSAIATYAIPSIYRLKTEADLITKASRAIGVSISRTMSSPANLSIIENRLIGLYKGLFCANIMYAAANAIYSYYNSKAKNISGRIKDAGMSVCRSGVEIASASAGAYCGSAIISAIGLTGAVGAIATTIAIPAVVSFAAAYVASKAIDSFIYR